jgi:gliding motility-associated lipoprotein GldH
MSFLSQRVRFMLTVFGVVVCFSACQNNPVAETHTEKSNAVFTLADSLTLAFDITDTSSLYDFTVEVRHKSDFAFQNIYTNIQTEYPNGQHVRQLLSLELSEPTGKPNGDCSGNVCKVEIPTKVFFNALGKYRITLAPFSRVDTLKGISRLGIRLNKTKELKNNTKK